MKNVDKGTIGGPIIRQPRGPSRTLWTLVWATLLLLWIVALCLVPDPRPLGAPDWSVKAMSELIGISEPPARAAATFVLRAAGMGLLGFLLALSVSEVGIRWAVATVIIGGPLLAIGCLWTNYGYFPLGFQIHIGVASVIVGGLAGLALRRSLATKIAFVFVTGGLVLWAATTGISDDVNEAARITGGYVLSQANDVPKGDAGFVAVVQEAFEFARENSHRTDAIHTNKAVIVALGVILGERRIATVARRNLNEDYSKQIKAIRSRVRLHGRGDLPKHFWVSAALTVLSDQERSITVGITKELMDAQPGGSGFSFVDLMADQAGNQFAIAATKDDESARLMQVLLRGEITTSDFFPPIKGIPEGMTAAEFQDDYGGMRGEKTSAVVDEIQTRLKTCKLLF